MQDYRVYAAIVICSILGGVVGFFAPGLGVGVGIAIGAGIGVAVAMSVGKHTAAQKGGESHDQPE